MQDSFFRGLAARRAAIIRRLSHARAQRRLNRRLAGARRLAFVCSGNVIRSPFAAAYCLTLARDQLLDLEVRSAGTCPIDRPQPVPPFAQAAALSWGVDLSSHHSAPLTRNLVSWADVIFVMQSEHRAFLRERSPETSGKVFLLDTVRAEVDADFEIPDPIAEPELCPAVYARVAYAVRLLLEGIAQPGVKDQKGS